MNKGTKLVKIFSTTSSGKHKLRNGTKLSVTTSSYE
jgi:hypothetical protein